MKGIAPHMPGIRVLVIDQRALISKGITVLLSSFPDFEVIGAAQSSREALELASTQAVDVMIIDVDLPGPKGGIELIGALRQAAPYGRIIVLTNLKDASTIHQALRAGAISYLLKNVSIEELADAIRAAYSGVPTLSAEATGALIQRETATGPAGRSLTAREQQVLELMARGLNNQQIASELSISLSTVQFHVSNILSKLGAHNRTEAATYAVRRRFGEAGPA